MAERTDLFPSQETPQEPSPSNLFTYARKLSEGIFEGALWFYKNRDTAQARFLALGAGIQVYGLTSGDPIRATVSTISAIGLTTSAYQLLEQDHQSKFDEVAAKITGTGTILGSAAMFTGNPDLLLPGMAISGISTGLSFLHYAARAEEINQSKRIT